MLTKEPCRERVVAKGYVDLYLLRRVDFDDVSFLDEPKHRIHFRQARALLKESKYEEAADMFGALLQAVYVVTGVVWYCDCMWA